MWKEERHLARSREDTSKIYRAYEFVERMTKACSFAGEDNVRSCTQVPRKGHADAASNRKRPRNWTSVYVYVETYLYTSDSRRLFSSRVLRHSHYLVCSVT